LDAVCQARKPLPDYAGWIQQAQALAAGGPAAVAAQNEGRIQAYTAQVDDLQRQLASIQAEASAAQSLLAERDGQLARLNAQLDKQQKSSVSQAEMKKVKVELDALRQELEAAQAARASLQATLDGHTAELEGLRTRLAEAKSALARASSLNLESLPAFKLAAAKAAADQGVRIQATPVLQDLADLVQIGTVYEQQLYRYGIGTFWEAAHLADADLDAALQPDELQRANLDYGALRADALRLAGVTGTVGLLWTGESPDDFEPIVGIGKVFEQRLYAAGLRSYAALAAATPEQLAAICQARKPLEPDYAGWIRQAQQLISRGKA
jgi:predicted flap endonuclease-1-like 5' DNA nuclease